MNWKSILVVVLALFVGFGVLIRIATRPPEPPAQQLFINGTVLTMDADNRIAEALAVRGDRIEAVGSTAEIMALAQEGTEVVDLGGKTLLPGFIDAHGHFPGSGQKVIAADLRQSAGGHSHHNGRSARGPQGAGRQNPRRQVGFRFWLRRHPAGGEAPPDPRRARCGVIRPSSGRHARFGPHGWCSTAWRWRRWVSTHDTPTRRAG